MLSGAALVSVGAGLALAGPNGGTGVGGRGGVLMVEGGGTLFGANWSINPGGFRARTNDIRNEDLMAGKYNFNIPGRLDASIVNLGSITAASGGFAALVAPGVRNSG